MDKRTLLAFALMAVVIVVTPLLFPSSRRAPVPRADTARVVQPQPASPAPMPVQSTVAPPAATATVAGTSDAVPVTTARARYVFQNPGAVPIAATIFGFKNLRPGRRDSVAVLEQPRTDGPLLHYRLNAGGQIITLDTIKFDVRQSGGTTTFTSSAPAITISYAQTQDGFRMNVRGSVATTAPGETMLIDLPSELGSVEADTLDDARHLAYAYRAPLRDVTTVPFSKLDTAVRADTGGMQWVAARNKYWLVALMKPVGTPAGSEFRGLVMRRDTATGKIVRTAHATTSLPLTNGQFSFDLYIGPQSWQELHAMGNELENVNSYAGWIPGVQPFATLIMRVLLWMKATFHVNYGWVLVLFGVTIRLLLWPLNQKAMRTSIQMQRLQPELQEIQRKYKNEPEKQRDALVKVYQAHGMSPLSPMLGCLPMLLPMPVLFALYFVFQNTIEFRGVAFLWLPDISLRDPYYIIPIVMGASMLLLSWIGMRGMPPNPQTKMMSYMMPAMFTVMFLNLASGLNLYYAVQNVAALPQQWIITRERAKAGMSTPPAARSRKT
ncbi:MAG TPA: YidC/Oxa1 family insertase periplasmic-domain containing protein [Gemmatimonadaceae bacterium]|nr:YidC/Oxa1 family insertase periplasmic-domain containing protein [Gemmatimonadaceae bacterium]